MGIDLAVMWAVIILFAVMMYVVMDGFDLGVGLLFPFAPDTAERDVMMNTVAPVWDGNETWLVLGGAGLLAAFPLAYAVVLSALHMPLTLMLVGLVLRGAAFELRFKMPEDKRGVWDAAFIGGSLLATFCQGVVLGTFLSGFEVVGGQYVGGGWTWLRPFPLFTGVALCTAYAMLGCTWLIFKTEGALQQRMVKLARPLLLALLAAIGLVSLWTPLAHPAIAARWFTWPQLLWFSPVPLLVALTGWALWRHLEGRPHAVPFLLTLALMFLGYTGLGISLWPHIVPPGIDVWQASAPPQSQGFALVGALFILPFTLMYTAWSYWVFRGKVREGDGYH